MNKRKQYHHGDLQPALLNAGLQVLDHEGLEAVGIRRLAREVGVAHSAPANHFPNRKALLTGLAIKCFEDFMQEISAAEAMGKDPAEIIRTISRVTIHYGLSYPNRYRLMFRYDMVNAEDEALHACMEKLYQTLLKSIKQLKPGKTMGLESYAVALWSMVHGYTVMRTEGTIIDAKDEVTGLPRSEAIVETWLAGIR